MMAQDTPDLVETTMISVEHMPDRAERAALLRVEMVEQMPEPLSKWPLFGRRHANFGQHGSGFGQRTSGFGQHRFGRSHPDLVDATPN